MKQIRILAATLLMLAGISVESLAQSPTIQKEVRLVQPTNGGTTFIGLKANSSTTTYTLTLPGSAPAANQILKINSVSGTDATATWADLPAAAWSLSGNAGTTSSNFLGTTDAQPLSIRTNSLERIAINGTSGAVSITSTLGVTGATALGDNLSVAGATTLTGAATLSNNLSVAGTSTLTGATTVKGLLTAEIGATVVGATNINTTGEAATVIGNTTDATAVTINAGATGRLTLGGLQAGASTDEILVLNTDNKVGKISMSTLNAGLYRAKGTQTITTAAESSEIAVTGLVSTDVINITLEGANSTMAIPSYYVVRDTNKFTVYFSAAFAGTFNYAVIK